MELNCEEFTQTAKLTVFPAGIGTFLLGLGAPPEHFLPLMAFNLGSSFGRNAFAVQGSGSSQALGTVPESKRSQRSREQGSLREKLNKERKQHGNNEPSNLFSYLTSKNKEIKGQS